MHIWHVIVNYCLTLTLYISTLSILWSIGSGQRGTNESPMKKKMASGANLVTPLEDSITRLCYSQPEPRCFGGKEMKERGTQSIVLSTVINVEALVVLGL
jgi:hypothetical protein